VVGEAGLFLIEVHCHDAEIDRRTLAQSQQAG